MFWKIFMESNNEGNKNQTPKFGTAFQHLKWTLTDVSGLIF
jgi:hypothetical protein